MKLLNVTVHIETYNGSSSRRSRFSRLFIGSVATIAIVALVSVVAFISIYFTRINDHEQLALLEHLNNRQQEQFQNNDGKVEELIARTEELEPLNDTVRLVRGFDAGLEEGVGIGGPELGAAMGRGDLRQVRILEAQAMLNRQLGQFDELVRLANGQEDFLLHFPSIDPVPNGRNVSGFGYRGNPFGGAREFHNGVDLVAPGGSPILAAADGIVVIAKRAGAYGLLVRIDHGYGFQTRYGHCSNMYVQVGDIVRRGEVVAAVGSTGRSTGNHLHYEVLRDGVNVDPALYILGDQDPIERVHRRSFVPLVMEEAPADLFAIEPDAGDLINLDEIITTEPDYSGSDPIDFAPSPAPVVE
ncbi:M23 family metallopeptidase [bacterium]|nr:M23 family metallopeptidase [bacterium]